MYASRQPHPDLPAIPEEVATPTSTPASSKHESPMEEIGFNCGDDSSNAESYANSYAFTLDNVGFDEENSLVGSVVGSVVGASGTVTAVHTPPPVYSPDRISKHERKLHRETCRTLGLPYSEDALDSSPSSGSDIKDDSVSEGASLSSGSAGELERKQKIDKMWPWPTKAGAEDGSYGMALDKMLKNVNFDEQSNPSSSSSSSKLTRISETTSTYANRMKEAIASFNERIEDAYEKSKQNANGDDNDMPSNAKSTTDHNPFRPSWIDSYKNANPIAKLTVGTTILFMLLCIIVILATVGVGSESSWNDDMSDVVTDLEPVLEEISDTNDTAATVPDVVGSETKSPDPSPAPLPSYNPTISPTQISPAFVPEMNFSNEPCIDKEGKFINARGKRRECHWLTIHDPYALYTGRLDAECGTVGELEPSELAMNCRYTCRGYNGCPMLGEAEGMMLVEKVDVVAQNISSVSLAQPAHEGSPRDTNFPTDPAQNPETNGPTAFPKTNAPTTSKPTGSPVGDVVLEPAAEPIKTKEEAQTDNVDLPTFVDIRGRERQCWWLDIRNKVQKQARRDANCVREMVQATCPSSCTHYAMMAVLNGQSANSGSSQVMSLARSFAARIGGNNDDNNHNENIDRTTPTVPLQTSTTTSVEMAEQYDTHQKHHEPPQDMCFDEEGYYLNHHGHPKQCPWLTNSRDPTDETRRIRNCGYHHSDYPEGTELGRMCKSTCGTCSP